MQVSTLRSPDLLSSVSPLSWIDEGFGSWSGWASGDQAERMENSRVLLASVHVLQGRESILTPDVLRHVVFRYVSDENHNCNSCVMRYTQRSTWRSDSSNISTVAGLQTWNASVTTNGSNAGVQLEA